LREKNKKGKKDEKEISFLRNKLYKTFCNEKIRKALKGFMKLDWCLFYLLEISTGCVYKVSAYSANPTCCFSLSQTQFNLENKRVIHLGKVIAEISMTH